MELVNLPLDEGEEALADARDELVGLLHVVFETGAVRAGLTEKETAYRTRIMQLDDDMRPDSIDRSLSGIGTTRTPELRDLRRRQLDNERRGVEILLGQATSNRTRLEEDVKQADLLVARIRQRLLPIIEREIDKLQP